jgi:pimeloyl-ACP methyl ester carboxylesterase
LRDVRAPTLVIHGQADRMVPLACGEDTARRIAGAELCVVPGMGHDFSPGASQRMLDALLPFLMQHTTLT